MAKSEHEDQLYRIFSNVNDWLKFAEAKNAMLIGFNGASIYGIVRALNLQFVKDHSFMQWYLGISIVILVFSLIITLISFAPKIKIIKPKSQSSDDVANVLFFEYLKGKTNLEIIKEVTGVSQTTQNTYTTVDKNIAEQIKQNSIIASRKYSLFAVAVWMTIIAYITVPVALIFWLYTYFNK